MVIMLHSNKMADTELSRNQENLGKDRQELKNPFVKPYYTDSLGSKSIGEPNWKPHGRNVASYPPEETEQNCRLGGNGLDWFSSLRCGKHDESAAADLRMENMSQQAIAKRDSRVNIQNTEQMSSNRMENRKQKTLLVDREQERMLQRRPVEMTLEIAVGAKRKVFEKRNGIPAASPGDKSYQVPEYSPEFHKQGCTLPVINFGGSLKYIPDTFVPLQDLPFRPRTTFEEREKNKKKKQELSEVVELDKWKPANPLVASLQPLGTHL